MSDGKEHQQRTRKKDEPSISMCVPLQSTNRRRVPVPLSSTTPHRDSSKDGLESLNLVNSASEEKEEHSQGTEVLNSKHDICFRWRLVWRPGANETDDRWAAPLHAGIKNECLVTNFEEKGQVVDSSRIARVLVGQLTPVAADVEFYRLETEFHKTREVPVKIDWWKCVHYGNEFKSPTLRLGLSYDEKEPNATDDSKTDVSLQDTSAKHRRNKRKVVIADWSISLIQRVFGVTQDTVDEWRLSLDRGSSQISPARGNYSVDIPVGAYLCSCNGCVCQDGQRGPIEFLQKHTDVVKANNNNNNSDTFNQQMTQRGEPVVERVSTTGSTCNSSSANGCESSTDLPDLTKANQKHDGAENDQDTGRIRVWLQFNEVSSHRGANPDSTRTFSFLGKFQGLFWLRAGLSGATSDPVWSRGPLITLEKFGEKYRPLLQRYNAAHLVGRRPRPSEAPSWTSLRNNNRRGRSDHNLSSVHSTVAEKSQQPVAISTSILHADCNNCVSPVPPAPHRSLALRPKDSKKGLDVEKNRTLLFPPQSGSKIEKSEEKNISVMALSTEPSPEPLLAAQADAKKRKKQECRMQSDDVKRHKKVEEKKRPAEKEQSKIGLEPILLRSLTHRDEKECDSAAFFKCLTWEPIEKSADALNLYSKNEISRPLCYALDLHFSVRVRNQSTVSLFNIDLPKPMMVYDWKQADDGSTVSIEFSWKKHKQRHSENGQQEKEVGMENSDTITEDFVYQSCKLWLEARSSCDTSSTASKIPLQAKNCGALGDSKFRIPLDLHSFFVEAILKPQKYNAISVAICLSRDGEKTLRKPLTCLFRNNASNNNQTCAISQWNLLPNDARDPPSSLAKGSLRAKSVRESLRGKRKPADCVDTFSDLAQPETKKRRSQMTKEGEGGEQHTLSTVTSSPGFHSGYPLSAVSLDNCDPAESDEETLDRVLYVLQTSRRESNEYKVSVETVESLCAQRDLLLNLAWRYRRKLVAGRSENRDGGV